MTQPSDYTIFCDGGARGNPGPAAYGFVVYDKADTLLTKRGEVIGETTNNVAEYRGAIEGLKALKAKIGKSKAKQASVTVSMDSELVVKQMNGIYKVKNENLSPLFLELWNLKPDFADVTFVHVRREKNTEADAMVNEALDGEQGGLAL